jgi:hypothetical protein
VVAIAVVSVPHGGKLGRQIGQMVGDEMDNLAFALDAALHADHAGRQDNEALAFVERRSDHQVGDAGFVLDGDKHDALGGSRLLSHKHQAGGGQPFAVAGSHRIGKRDAPKGPKPRDIYVPDLPSTASR